MSSTLTQQGPSSPADPTGPKPYASSFEPRAWVWDARRICAVAAILAFAYGAWDTGHHTMMVLAVVQVVELAAMCLPWRVPRLHRSAISFWAETLAGLIGPVAAVVLALVAQPRWVQVGATWWWYVVGTAFAFGLVFIGNLSLRALVSGELSFVFGPTPRAHGSARAFASAVAPAGEELLYRGCLLGLGGATPLGLLGAGAFIGRHHAQPGTNRRGTSRSMLVEILGAVGWLVLTLVSGSVYPAIASHLLYNVPSVALEIMREHDDRRSLDA